MKFTQNIQLRYTDFDTQKFVNHSIICTYIELTYLNFVKYNINGDWVFSNLPIVLKQETTHYHKPITPECNPVCDLVVEEIKGSSFAMKIIVRELDDEQQIYTSAYRELVYIDLENPRPKRLGISTIENLSKFLK